MPGQQIVERAPHAVDIRSMVDAMAIDGLLGREIVGCAEDIFVVGDRERRGFFIDKPSQAEVEHLHRATAIDQKVGRLDVAMNQARLVGKAQAFGALGGSCSRPRFRSPSGP